MVKLRRHHYFILSSNRNIQFVNCIIIFTIASLLQKLLNPVDAPLDLVDENITTPGGRLNMSDNPESHPLGWCPLHSTPVPMSDWELSIHTFEKIVEQLRLEEPKSVQHKSNTTQEITTPNNLTFSPRM